jgi:hypothetical protein
MENHREQKRSWRIMEDYCARGVFHGVNGWVMSRRMQSQDVGFCLCANKFARKEKIHLKNSVFCHPCVDVHKYTYERSVCLIPAWPSNKTLEKQVSFLMSV